MTELIWVGNDREFVQLHYLHYLDKRLVGELVKSVTRVQAGGHPPSTQSEVNAHANYTTEMGDKGVKLRGQVIDKPKEQMWMLKSESVGSNPLNGDRSWINTNNGTESLNIDQIKTFSGFGRIQIHLRAGTHGVDTLEQQLDDARHQGKWLQFVDSVWHSTGTGSNNSSMEECKWNPRSSKLLLKISSHLFNIFQNQYHSKS